MRLPKYRASDHPGKFLRDILNDAGGIIPTAWARHWSRDTGIPSRELLEVIECKRSVTPKIARALKRATGVPAYLWLNHQAAHDASLALQEKKKQNRRRSR